MFCLLPDHKPNTLSWFFGLFVCLFIMVVERLANSLGSFQTASKHNSLTPQPILSRGPIRNPNPRPLRGEKKKPYTRITTLLLLQQCQIPPQTTTRMTLFGALGSNIHLDFTSHFQSTAYLYIGRLTSPKKSILSA